jgi:hypothetical protein
MYMKILSAKLCIVSVLLAFGNVLAAQSGQKVYIGPGIGLDYGGIGGKVEYLPVKYVGIFGGLGYNLLAVGWNVGALCKIQPDNIVSPSLMAFYGYNAIFEATDGYSAQYRMLSYGMTFGVNLDIKRGNRGNKLNVGFFVPVRSPEFMDNYKRAVNDSRMAVSLLLPVTVSVGYTFRL